MPSNAERDLVDEILASRQSNPHWKVDDSVIRVLGCHGTDGELARQFEQWRTYLTGHPETYPERPFIEAIARRLGATL